MHKQRSAHSPSLAEDSPPVDRSEISRLLDDYKRGEPSAFDRLIPIVYQELRVLARGHLRREGVERTLQPTALVHEAYLRLMDNKVSWNGREHFFAVASTVMRRILVDEARRRGADKRNGLRVDLSVALNAAADSDRRLLELDQALEQLAQIDERRSKVFELRFFAGLTVAEVAEVVGVAKRSVERDLQIATAWVRRRLGNSSQ